MVRTTPGERERIKEVIAGVHNAVFAAKLQPDDITLTQLLSEENEMDTYGRRFGVNVALWREWGVEKKLEVVLHEMAHLAEPAQGHRPSFWEHFIDIIEVAEAHQEELEDVFDTAIDFDRVKQIVVDEVHPGIIDRRMDTVAERREWCRRRFGLADDQ